MDAMDNRGETTMSAAGGRGGQLVGCVLAVLQAVLYSTMGIFGKLLYATGFDAQQLLILRFACATVLLGGFMLVWRREPLMSRQPAVYVQSALFFASSVLYFVAVERLNAGMTTVVFYLYPVMVALLNLVVYRERISASVAAALVLTTAGLVLVSGIASGGLALDGLGIACALGSALAFALETVVIQKTGRTEGTFTATFTLTVVTLAASCALFAPEVPTMLDVTPEQVALACGMALANTILPIAIYIQAVKRIGGTKSSLLSISETPSSLLLAFLILGETITPVEGAGIVLIVAAIALVTAAPLLANRKSGTDASHE